jgi:hypothetical protein
VSVFAFCPGEPDAEADFLLSFLFFFLYLFTYHSPPHQSLNELQYSYDERSVIRAALNQTSGLGGMNADGSFSHGFGIGVKKLITLADSHSRIQTDRAEKLASAIINADAN